MLELSSFVNMITTGHFLEYDLSLNNLHAFTYMCICTLQNSTLSVQRGTLNLSERS